MNGNKLLTGFLVLGMGLSLVACSNEKPETKKEEAKVAEKKKEEKQIVTQDRTAGTTSRKRTHKIDKF